MTNDKGGPGFRAAFRLSDTQCSNGDDRSLPLLPLLVLLVQRIDVDDDVRSFLPHRITIHASRCPAGEERAVLRVLRLVLRALKAALAGIPAKRRVLMRARKAEREHPALVAREDHVVVSVDRRAMMRRRKDRKRMPKEGVLLIAPEPKFPSG